MTSSPLDSPTDEIDLPGFGPPRRPPTNDPLDPLASILTTPAPGETPGPETPGPTIDEGGDWPNGSADEGESTGWKIPPGGPSPGSTADASAFRPVIATVVGLASLGLHARLAPGDNSLWIADDDDIESISAPLARIAARHTPLHAQVVGDVADGIEAAVAATGYAVKNLRRQHEMAAAGFAHDQAQHPAGPG